MTFFAPPSSTTAELAEFENEYAINVARKHIGFHLAQIAKLEAEIAEIERLTCKEPELALASLIDFAAVLHEEARYHKDRIALMERCIHTLSIKPSDLITAE